MVADKGLKNTRDLEACPLPTKGQQDPQHA